MLCGRYVMARNLCIITDIHMILACWGVGVGHVLIFPPFPPLFPRGRGGRGALIWTVRSSSEVLFLAGGLCGSWEGFTDCL